MKLKIKPLESSDLNLFFKWLIHHRRRKNNFYMNTLKTNEDLWRWYKDSYLKPYKDDVDQWLIMLLNGKKVGAVYYSGCQEECEVMIFMAPRWKNKGLGSLFLLLSEKWIRNKYNKMDYLRADIEYDNIASIKTFEALGYKKEDFGDYYKYL
jgi:RimJ/RimL family protein N-acetyltransferase